jgi:hypothetical protein
LLRNVEQLGLGCISTHWAADELFKTPDKSIEYAKEFVMTQMAIAALGPWKPRTTATPDDVKRYVEPFNTLAEKAYAAGIVALLHNEGFVSEYIDGKPVYDMMIAELNPATTKLQLQVSAMQFGYDPVTYFNKYPGRFLSMPTITDGEIGTMNGYLREICGNRAELKLEARKLRLIASGKNQLVETPAEEEYTEQMRYFIECCEKQMAPELCPPAESAEAVRIANLLRASRDGNGKELPC